MTDPATRPAGPPRAAGMLLMACVIAACSAAPTPGASSFATPPSTVASTATPAVTDTPRPTATPEPELSLALPESRDQRRVQVLITPEVPEDAGGRIVVVVTNLSDQRVVELVLRWPMALRDTLFLSPFQPSEQRIVDGGPPLLQDWTKWVDGPGERGEPAGTTSLGWGPLDPGATLTIPILVARNAEGPVAFDLQVLAGEAILTLEQGGEAELRVEIP